MTIDCVALLLGRKGSKGLPGKNTMHVLGRPISHYSIMVHLLFFTSFAPLGVPSWVLPPEKSILRNCVFR